MKKIWTYWHQGWGNAPDIVKQCRESWIRLNPEYELISLDQYSLGDYVDLAKKLDLSRKDLTVQKTAALSRLELLCNYGGVWTDATVMCMRPLDEWLAEYYDADFFVFRNPGKDRIMSNWFIAAESDSILLRRLHESFLKFYQNNYFCHHDTLIGRRLVVFFGRRWNQEVETDLPLHV